MSDVEPREQWTLWFQCMEGLVCLTDIDSLVLVRYEK
jgi:hypothetical protein